MRTSYKQSYPPNPASDLPPIVYDDGGSGLLELCKARFKSPEYEVECDARHTTWIKRADDGRSFGLAPWLLRTRSAEEVLKGVEDKFGVPAVKC